VQPANCRILQSNQDLDSLSVEKAGRNVRSGSTSIPTPSRRAVLGTLAAAAALPPIEARADVRTVRLAKQFGISYLPLTLMEREKLLEAHCKKAGIEITTEWLQFTGGAPMNDAILAGALDFASGGVGPLLTIWGKTRANLAVKAVAALNAMPLFLVTTNPAVKTIADFTEKDRIALPGVKSSIQAVTLQMAAAKAFGASLYSKLDPFTVSLGHPDAQIALLNGRSEITAHFASAPFMYEELKDPRVRKVLDSFEVLGGPHTFNLVWATTTFATQNPLILRAFADALAECMELITKDTGRAAAIWVEAEKSKMSVDDAERLIRLPENQWTMTPKRVMTYVDFMNRVGVLTAKPADWKELFFDVVHHLPGS
jgi:NitT/TauT family transport system substrate-binding protein